MWRCWWAKLAYGFYNSIPHDAFDILVNTGDDFIHLGLHVSPDLDTVIYTLSEEVEFLKDGEDKMNLGTCSMN